MFLLNESENEANSAKLSGQVLEKELEKLMLKCKDAIAIVREDLNLDAVSTLDLLK